MEEGFQVANLRHEVVWCTGEKGICNATKILEFMKAMFDCDGNTR
jgi:hypothetical protein